MMTPASGTDDHSAIGAPAAAADHEAFVPVTRSGRRPSPPWYGAIQIGVLFLMATIVLTYTLLDWGWQQRLGGWNYVATLGLIPFIAVLMRFWQADETR